MRGIHAGGQRRRIGVERQPPLPEEGHAEGDEEDAADPACRECTVPPADNDLGHTGHVGGDGGGEEPQGHRFMQRDGGQHQQRQGSAKGPDGDPAAVTHVAHVHNHPREGAT